MFSTYNQNMPMAPAGGPAGYADADYDGSRMGVLNPEKDREIE